MAEPASNFIFVGTTTSIYIESPSPPLYWGKKKNTIGLPNQKIYNKTLLKWKNISDIGLG